MLVVLLLILHQATCSEYARSAAVGHPVRLQIYGLIVSIQGFPAHGHFCILQGMHSSRLPVHLSVPAPHCQHLRLALTLPPPAQPHPLPPPPCPPPAPLVHPWVDSSKPLLGPLPHPSLGLLPAQPLFLQKANLKASHLVGTQPAAAVRLPCSLLKWAQIGQT